MFTIFELVVGALLLVSFLAIITSKKLRRRIVGLWSRKTDDAADMFGDVVTDTQDAIVTAKVQVDNFESKIAGLMASIKLATNEHSQMVSEANKWHRIAEQAAIKNDIGGARTALGKKQAAEKRAVAIKNETDRNTSMCEELRSRLSSRKDEVRDAEVDVSVQEARLAGLKMREDMLQSVSAFGGTSQDITSARRSLDEYEARLDAKDELRGNEDDLERLYMVDTNVDEALNELLSNVNKSEPSYSTRDFT